MSRKPKLENRRFGFLNYCAHNDSAFNDLLTRVAIQRVIQAGHSAGLNAYAPAHHKAVEDIAIKHLGLEPEAFRPALQELSKWRAFQFTEEGLFKDSDVQKKAEIHDGELIREYESNIATRKRPYLIAPEEDESLDRYLRRVEKQAKELFLDSERGRAAPTRPRTMEWALKHLCHKKNYAQIAEESGASEDTVKKEVQEFLSYLDIKRPRGRPRKQATP